jgi:hypothetical protein
MSFTHAYLRPCLNSHMRIENSFYKTPCYNLTKHYHHRGGQRAREAERVDERDTVHSSRRGDMGGIDFMHLYLRACSD